MSPNAPKTPGRHIRIDDALWSAAMERAAEQGTNLSDVIRTLLREWVEGKV